MNSRQTLTGQQRHIRARYNARLRNRFKKPIPRSIVPSFFTLMNLFCGFLAIVQIYEGQVVYAAWLIVVAGLFDVMDGFMARLSNGTSEFGIELDSLSDVVSFGVAPGFLIYHFSLNELSTLGLILSTFPALFGAVRLARFNVEARNGEKNEYFKGLPIPAQAMILVAFVLLFNDGDPFFDNLKNGVNTVLIPTVILLSGLMVTTIPFDKIPRFNKKMGHQDRIAILFFLLYLTLIMVFRHYGLMIAFAIFIVRGVGRGALKFIQELREEDPST
jgi:CDP-diacylglycerol---serine O-phosphatidyltransferase